MGLKLMNTLAVLLLSLLVSSTVAKSNVFDVTSSKYGGKPHSDISKALTMAWIDACSSTSTSTIVVPRGTYKLQQAKFEGPCKAPIQFQLQGTLQAPKDRSQLDDSWVYFKTINMLTLSGGGTFDGQGALYWKEHHDSTPIDIRFQAVNNSTISDIASIDSAKFHISAQGCNNVTFKRLTITAPGDSPNTDGIHISRSTRITVANSYIATGDDCVSIGDGAKQILVSDITCGPGHGISIGSLGKYPNEEPVVGVTVKNCTLTNTTNGARIKTWPDSPGASIAWDILFQDIIMVNVKNPILIDQNYCDKGKSCKLQVPSKVQISDVRFKNIKGSSSSPVAVNLECSRNAPCRNVELSDIDITYSGDKNDTLTSKCFNVKPRITRVTKPLACANLGDIPIYNSTPLPPPTSASPPLPTPPSASPSLHPVPVQQSPPPVRKHYSHSPVRKHHSPSPPPMDVSLPSPPPRAEPVVDSPPRAPSDDSSPPIIMVYGYPYPVPRTDDGGYGPTSSAAANSHNFLGLKPTVTATVLISAMALRLL